MAIGTSGDSVRNQRPQDEERQAAQAAWAHLAGLRGNITQQHQLSQPDRISDATEMWTGMARQPRQKNHHPPGERKPHTLPESKDSAETPAISGLATITQTLRDTSWDPQSHPLDRESTTDDADPPARGTRTTADPRAHTAASIITKSVIRLAPHDWIKIITTTAEDGGTPAVQRSS